MAYQIIAAIGKLKKVSDIKVDENRK